MSKINLEKMAQEGRLSLTLTTGDTPGEGVHKDAIQVGIRSFAFAKDVPLRDKARFMRWGIEVNRKSGGSFKTQHGTWAELKLARDAGLVEESTKKTPTEGFDPFA